MTDDARGAQMRRFVAIDEAFRRGDLDASRRGVTDPSVVPNGTPLNLAVAERNLLAVHHRAEDERAQARPIYPIG